MRQPMNCGGGAGQRRLVGGARQADQVVDAGEVRGFVIVANADHGGGVLGQGACRKAIVDHSHVEISRQARAAD